MAAPLYSKHGFADVTYDDDAVARADQVPELRSHFEKLGFRSLGFMAHRPFEHIFWVHEVLTSSEEDAFVTLALSPSNILKTEPRTVPIAILQTALANGSVIVTTNCPAQLRLLNHPKAGSFLEGRSAASAEELWDRHRERVAEIRFDEATSLLPHDTMDLRLRIAERCTAVAHFVVAFALLSAFFAFVGMGILWLEAMSWFNSQVLGGAVAWAFVFFTLGNLPLMVAFMWLVRN